MDMAVYLEKKQKGTVKLQKLTKDVYQLIAYRYHPDTGAETAPEIAQIDVKAIDDSIAEVDKQIAAVQDRKKGLQALKADMEALKEPLLAGPPA